MFSCITGSAESVPTPSCVDGSSTAALGLGVLPEGNALSYQRLALSSGFFWNNIYLVLIYFF